MPTWLARGQHHRDRISLVEGTRRASRRDRGRVVRRKVDVIVTWGTVSTIAAKPATSVLPIVFAAMADPLGTGIVASLARPGGNQGAAGFGEALSDRASDSALEGSARGRGLHFADHNLQRAQPDAVGRNLPRLRQRRHAAGQAPLKAARSVSLGSERTASARPAERARGCSDAAHPSSRIGPFPWRWNDRSRWRYRRRRALWSRLAPATRNPRAGPCGSRGTAPDSRPCRAGGDGRSPRAGVAQGRRHPP